MDYIRLGKHLAQSYVNGTESHGGPRMPLTLFDAIIPGWSLISHFLSHTFGVDVGLIVTVLALFLGISKGSVWLWGHIQYIFEAYFMSRVHINNDDLLFDTVLKWLANQRVAKSSTSVRAKTKTGSAFDEDESEKEAAEAILDEHGYFNYGKLQARVPPQYEPHYGDNHFWHKGRFFRFSRTVKSHQSIWSDGDEDELVLYCIGRSTEPIKQLLQDIKLWTIREQVAKTSIRHATSRNFRGSSSMTWSARNPRPSRPISTVILDEKQKAAVIDDMNEFLDPRSPAWYASRGIPYRRGYLFHGPPGTGKTSLSFALAGIFGLDLYCFSLNDPDLTEGDLRELFNNLPRRCIVLLEDIDEAGIKRPDHKSITAPTSDDKKTEEPQQNGTTTTAEKATNGEVAVNGVKENGETTKTDGDNKDKKSDEKQISEVKPPAETQWTLQDLAKAIMSVSKDNDNDDNPPDSKGRTGKRRGKNPLDKKSGKDAGISLSGLLNAIDGVATHEGRVLIMTTNHPEALDEALVRAGRVDLRVAFDYASSDQIRALFLRMYAVDVGSFNKITNLDLFSHHKKEAISQEHAMATLEELARTFAEKLPDREFSPSEVQGYLLKHKKTPQAAFDGADEWVAEERKRKAEKAQAASETTATAT